MVVTMAYVVIGNNRGPRGLKGETGDPLNQAGADFMVTNFDFLRGGMDRAQIVGGPQSGLLWAVMDAAYRLTWLQVDETDGGPSEDSTRFMQQRLGVTQLDDPSVLTGFLDAAMRYTELHTNHQGNVPDWVLARWASRMQLGGGSGLTASDRILVDGDLLPAFPDTAQVYGFGSSTMQLLGSFLVNAFPGAQFHAEGKSGEKVQHTVARQGSTPALLTVTGGSIPASGSVTVVSSNMPASSSLKPFTGTLNGVPGVLSSTGSELTFTRTGSGAIVTVPPGSAFVSSIAPQVRQGVGLVNLGKNNTGDSGDVVSLVMGLTNTAFTWLSPLVKRCVVMTHFVDSDQSTGSTQYANVKAINQEIRDRYKDALCFDLEAYILSAQIWTDTGLTPTSEDLTQQAAGVKPTSLSADAAHLNATANQAVANQIKSHYASAGWYPEG